MKKKIIIFCFFTLLAVLFAVMAVLPVVYCRDRKPVLLHAPEEAQQCVDAVMQALCSGDFSGAEEMLYGNPDLGVHREPADPVGVLVWEAYIHSLDYRLVGDCYPTDSGLAQDVKIISLELPTATAHLGQRVRELLQKEMDAAEDVSDIYDENNEYREELVRSVFEEAARQALEEDVRYGYRVITVPLVYSDGQWWVVADQALLNTISGGMVD